METVKNILILTFAIIFQLSLTAGRIVPHLDTSGLKKIEEQIEDPVNDFQYKEGEMQTGDSSKFDLSSLDTILQEQELPINDVEFSNEEIDQYQKAQLHSILETLIPVGQDEEAAVSDFTFTEAEKRSYGQQ